MTHASASYSLKTNVHLAEAVADMLSNTASANRDQLAAEGMNADEIQEELAEAEARATTLRKRLERNLTILRKGTEETEDAELAPNDPAQRAESENLQTVLNRWAKESGSPDQHVAQYAYAVKRFDELHGRFALSDIARAHLREFKDALVKLPRSTRADIRSAPLARAIKIGDRENLPRIEEKTARKHVMAVSTLLAYAVGWGYIDKSPADGLRFLSVDGSALRTTSRSGSLRRSCVPSIARLLANTRTLTTTAGFRSSVPTRAADRKRCANY